MRHSLSLLVLPFTMVMFQGSTRAQEVVVPAGTLLHCTLDDPNLSSATASVGDPVICHLRSLEEFGHVVFPRGSYLGGHIESYKEPGHFFGKGNLKLTFDRIGLPASDIPVPSKITTASGYHVDRKGAIVGHGHPKRDTVEWLLPPLWPWKIITLPARGPRPTLKAETEITLRLMDDLVVPRAVAEGYSNDRFFNRPVASSRPAPLPTNSFNEINRRIAYAPPSIPSPDIQPSIQASDATPTSVARVNRENETSQVHLSVIAMKSGEIYSVARYRIDSGSLLYELPSGVKGSIDLPEVDWQQTSQLNAAVSSLAPVGQRR